ncbi:Disease resistance protein RGA2 [Ananas comosus]|uniref:Disease resistance protein RGA2 n=1 Tax=Ananas comosus TaxID=4615 RepID=A0A199VVJ5_ANACO|nr:Disease resistance protein RGA2 [Ananas comosus]
MSTGLTIGGWIAQAFIQTLVDKASSFFLQHSRQSYDLAHDLRQLSSSLKTARAVLCRAQRKGTANKHDDLARLAAQLRDAVYDAEDLLGDLDYEALRRKIEEGEAVDPATFSPSSPADIFEGKLREVGDRLDRIAKELQDFLNSDHDQMLPVKRERETETSSFLTMPKVFGREDEKETIVELLLSGSGGVTLSVLPIIGAVGVGKTTLAQYVYNDPRVSEHFNLKMWVCVSHSFDVKRLTKQMIESATGEMQADLSLDSLQVILQRKVMRRRFLLVLDDVRREDDSEEWRMLCAPLRQGCQGSKILVTTRSRRVAGVMGTKKPMHLRGLSDDDCWKFLKSRAFGPEGLAVPSDLEAIGTSMAAKLKGSPTAATSLAGRLSRLNGRTGFGEWRRIMNKEMWESQQDGIMEPLPSSYQYLPGHLKQCFSFCSIFPKEYPFNQRELVGVWMAQGFIAPRENTQMEDDGHRIAELKDLSQIQERLHIKNLENIQSEEDACQAKLDNKEYVDELFLEWSPSRSNFAFDTEVLEGLRPHRNLKQLEIKHYGGERSPSWLHRNLLPYISKLHIENCPNLKEILCLPSVLTELRLVDLGLDTLPRLWDEGSSGVGSSSHGSGSIKSSSLSKLHVERFPRLTSLEQWLLPLHLPVIKSIQIIDCEELLSVPPESFESFVHLEDLNISNCPQLTCTGTLGLPLSIKRFMLDACGGLDNSLPTCLESLTSLTVMKLYKCQHITYLPRWILGGLTSLESLYISDCPAIFSLRGLEALTSLKNLTILKCYGLKIYEPLMSSDALKMWVCVSNDPFDVKRLTREILESATENERSNSTSLTNLDSLQVILKEKVMSKRYLLVLDDVWNENGREWERLHAPLKYGLQGSMILVTTRSPKVVEVMTGTLEPIFLNGLPEDVYRKFFKTCAFGLEDSEDRPETEEIPEQIAAKLKGSPLAAKTLGGLLNSNMDVRHRRTIMNSEIWELQQNENDIMPALRLSCKYLPFHWKRCFSICSIYPQDYNFNARELADLWIAQGFIVAPQANLLLEDVRNRHLRDLTSRRLDAEDELVSKVTDIGKLTNLQYLNYFKVQKEHGHRIDELKNLKQLRGSLHIEKLENVESREDACQANLDNKEYIDNLILQWSRDRNTCTGSIGFSVDIEVIEDLKPHRNLKSLSIRRYGGDKLPSWLQAQTLPCLNALSLVDCPSITDLPCVSLFLKKLNLINLRLKSLPILWGEGSIHQGIYARGSNSIRGSALTELNVRWCQNLTSFEEWLLPERLPSIKIIHVIGCIELVSLPVERFKDFISLQKLSIEHCPNLTSSKKLELNPSIKVLKLKSCGEVERSLPGCLQNLTSLIKLEICRCLHLESLPGQLLQHMRALKVLRITFCPELRSIGGLDALISLESLTIFGCPKLTEFEPLPSDHEVQRKDKSIFNLDIEKTVILKQPFLQRLYQSSITADIVTWANIPPSLTHTRVSRDHIITGERLADFPNSNRFWRVSSYVDRTAREAHSVAETSALKP